MWKCSDLIFTSGVTVKPQGALLDVDLLSAFLDFISQLLCQFLEMSQPSNRKQVVFFLVSQCPGVEVLYVFYVDELRI